MVKETLPISLSLAGLGEEENDTWQYSLNVWMFLKKMHTLRSIRDRSLTTVGAMEENVPQDSALFLGLNSRVSLTQLTFLTSLGWICYSHLSIIVTFAGYSKRACCRVSLRSAKQDKNKRFSPNTERL